LTSTAREVQQTVREFGETRSRRTNGRLYFSLDYTLVLTYTVVKWGSSGQTYRTVRVKLRERKLVM